MDCSGPCLPHCSIAQRNVRCSTVVLVLAYASLGYVIASAVYLVVARLALDTPFDKSLTSRQRSILDESKRQRRCVFLIGVGVAVLVLSCSRPLRPL